MVLSVFTRSILRSRFLVAAGATLAIGGAAAAALYLSLEPRRAEARHLANGDKYLARQRPADAVIEYRAALQNRPDSADTFRKLADAYRRAGDRARAGDAFRHAADLSAADLQTQLRAGWYSLLQGRPEDARRYAERVLASDPDNPSARRLLANALAALGNLDGAVEELRAASVLDPLNAAIFNNIGLVESARGNGDAARAAFAEAFGLGATGGGGALFPSRHSDERDPPRLPVTIVDVGPDLDSDQPGAILTGTVEAAPDGTRTIVRFAAVDTSSGRSIEGLSASTAPPEPPVTPVPEPGSMILLLSGGLAGAGARWVRRRRAQPAGPSA